MTTTEPSPGPRRHNIRSALLLGGFALLVFVSAFPFWQGVFELLSLEGR